MQQVNDHQISWSIIVGGIVEAEQTRFSTPRSTFWTALAWLSVLGAIAWALLRIGPNTVVYPTLDAQRALAWPNPGIRLEEAYTRTSPISSWILKASGFESTNAWLMIHLIAIGVALTLIVLWAGSSVDVSSGQRHRAMRLAILGPITAVVIAMVGTYDPFTVIAIVAALFAWKHGSIALMVLSGILLGIAHAEQGFLAFCALAAAAKWGTRGLPESLRSLKTPGWVIVGILGGRVLLSIVLVTTGVDPTEGRSSWLADPLMLRYSIIGSLNYFPVLLMASFAGLWGIVFLSMATARCLRQVLAWAVPLTVLFLFSVITLDHTRVFVITSLPLLLVLIPGVLEHWSKRGAIIMLLSLEAMAWLVIPLRLFTSPDGPTYIAEVNVLDQWVMFTSHLLNGGWT